MECKLTLWIIIIESCRFFALAGHHYFGQPRLDRESSETSGLTSSENLWKSHGDVWNMFLFPLNLLLYIYIIYIYIHIYDIHILVGKWCSGFKWLTTYGFIMFHWFLDQPQWDFGIFRRNWGCKKHDLRGLDVAWGKPFIGSKVRVLAEKMIRYDQITRITPQCSKQVQKWFSGQPGTFFF